MKKLLFFIVFALVLNYNPGFSQSESECISGDCEDGYGVYFWGGDTKWTGDKYYGYWKDGLMHGEGTYYFSSGSVYEGSWITNQKDGQGTYTWEDGGKYVGGWKENQQHGFGIHYFADGTSMSGVWEYGEFVEEEEEEETGCVSGDCVDGYGKYVWEDGEWYEGYWVNDKRNGEGTNYFANGSMYTGEWKDDMRHGYGTNYYADETSKTGYWEYDEFLSEEEEESGCIYGDCEEGYGTYTWDSGEKYEGYWENNKRNGSGINYYSTGNVYTGEWLNDEQHGYGTTTYANGDTYDGYFSYHKRSGSGIYTFKDGKKYVGEFLDNLYHGQGTMYYTDGTTKSGLWEYDEFIEAIEDEIYTSTGCVYGDCVDGYGIYVWEDGERYDGNWENDKRSGQGTNYFSTGSQYTGEWRDDDKHGTGTYTYPETSIYESYMGDYLYDAMTGQGTLLYKDGQKYVGSFEDNMYHGEGTMTFTDGTTQSGIWENDEYVGTSQDNYGCVSGDCYNGYGTYVYENNDKYIGYFDYGSFSGEGTYFAANGDKYTGEFEDNEYNGQGTYTFAVDGRKYVGQWIGGKYNGYGTMYYANGTTVSGIWEDNEYLGEDISSGNPPIITWLAPEYYSSSSSTSNTTIKVCIKSDSDLSNSQIYVNNNLQINDAVRGYNVVSSACDYTLERNITLTGGENIIKIVAENDAGTSTSDTRTIVFNAATEQAKFALVIGNGNYSTSPLRNPANDARSMAAELENLGFEVMLYTDISQTEMKRNIRSFGERLIDNPGISLFYFAGHGIQLNGVNYLIPVDAIIEKEQDVELESVSLKRVLGEMEYARTDMNIVILDACRNNPFVRSFRSGGTNGLATTIAPSGTFIAYATAPGSVAADGTGENGLYTQELLKALRVPGLKIEELFKLIRNNVYELSNQQQVPWDNSSIFGDFYFKEK